jgi:hypothetical protein
MVADGRKVALDALKRVASVDVIEFQTTEAYCNLELTNLK